MYNHGYQLSRVSSYVPLQVINDINSPNSCGIACLRIKLKEKSLIYFSKPV